MTFADLGLSTELLRAVSDSGYNDPTPIQRAAIPSVLMGKDLVGIAQTGTGKTAGFVLPMIDILSQGRARARMPRSLILEPTRGQLCVERDAIHSRMGGSCPIKRFRLLEPRLP